MSSSSSAPSVPVHEAAARGYDTTSATASYENGRPTYAVALVEEIVNTVVNSVLGLPSSSKSSARKTVRVLDLGAGTGIFTRVLLSCTKRIEERTGSAITFDITAVEPVKSMRERFSQLTPLPIVEGTAYCLPQASESIDIVFVAQAFHWFGTHAALEEIGRVLQPNGALVLIWNDRQHTVPWVKELDGIIDDCYTPDVPRQQTKQWKKAFEVQPPVFQPLQYRLQLDAVKQVGGADMVMDRVMSISVVACLPEAERAVVAERVRRLLREHPDVAGKTQFEIPYQTEVFWAQKLKSA